MQLVLRPDHDFRGYAGQIVVRHGPRRATPSRRWPSGRTARVKRIVTWDGDLEMAHAPMSVTLTLEDEIDISRGDMLGGRRRRRSAQRFEADVVWMDERPLDPARVYLLKHTTRTVTAEVDHGARAESDRHRSPSRRRGRSSSTATPTTARTGSFILIDPATNFTAGAGMITERGARATARRSRRPSAAERLARLARGAATDAEAVEAVRQALEELLDMIDHSTS